MKPRVLLGMSGGVDSSVAAALLQRQGYDVIGITMKMWPQDCLDRERDKACGPFAMVDARAVAEQLGFPHYVVDEQAQFQKIVIDYFVAEYRAGRTPNPCVLCNERVKFGALIEKANALGADYIATGHYARIEKNGRVLLKKSCEPQKDQTYFLFSLKQDQLARSLFPLGEMTKKQVRTLAAELKLKVADKEDSQEICFVPEHDYRRFLREFATANPSVGGDGELAPRLRGDEAAASAAQAREGEIVDRSGRVLGRHAGIEYFTIGQRKGLGISAPATAGKPQPLYVVALEAQTNRVVVGNPEELMTREFYVERPNWIAFDSLETKIQSNCRPLLRGGDQIESADSQSRPTTGEDCRRETFSRRDQGKTANEIRGYKCTVKIRSQHAGAACEISIAAPDTSVGAGGRFRVTLDVPERAVTPGQAAVFYDGDLVLGGGWICPERSTP